MPALANLGLGIIAVVPLWFLLLFAVNFPLAGMGFTSREPTENDGMLPWALLLVPLWGLFLGMWIPVNLLMRDRSELSAGRYWSLASLVSLSPTVVLMVLIEIL
ncbi:hypothetical protein [Streptomyces lincolnensis]|uniref:hypothetical protein n=1 Tax=Streptomyces lincolnensis TaxID=1915 RepID=UPI001E3819BB|nr:hypothetical protein [Streptomyces lincolnensis]